MAKTVHTPNLHFSQNRMPILRAARQDTAPQADAQERVPPAGGSPALWQKRRGLHLVLTNLHGVRHPNRGLVSDILVCCGVRHLLSNYGTDRDGEGTGGRNAEGAEITQGARKGKGNFDCWHGYANAPPPLCTTHGACCAHSLCGFVVFVAKTSRTPKLLSPRSGSNPESGGVQNARR